ncbi:glutaminase [Salinicola tamaricis]|uniref:glutaminase n=1 Tax=Salinicola tamaricis TaxID=1771309 RepID=UPI003BF46946
MPLIPALAEVVPDQFGIAVCDVAGNVYRAGAADTPFSIQSISKLLNLIIAIQHLDEADIWQRVGREPSGQAFNSIVQLEVERGIPRNPFINAGALLVTDLLVSRIMSIHWVMRELARRLAGNPALAFDTRVASSEMAHKARNAALAYLMKAYGNLHGEVDEVLDVYFHGCALSMSCVDVARAFAFLANRGVHPDDGSVIVTPAEPSAQRPAAHLRPLRRRGDFAWCRPARQEWRGRRHHGDRAGADEPVRVVTKARQLRQLGRRPARPGNLGRGPRRRPAGLDAGALSADIEGPGRRDHSGRIAGNSSTSRIEGLSVSSITRRSMPMPSPAVGGMPYSSART